MSLWSPESGVQNANWGTHNAKSSHLILLDIFWLLKMLISELSLQLEEFSEGEESNRIINGAWMSSTRKEWSFHSFRQILG